MFFEQVWKLPQQFIYQKYIFFPAIPKVVVKNQAIKKQKKTQLSVKPARKSFLAPILSLRELCEGIKSQGFHCPEVYHQAWFRQMLPTSLLYVMWASELYKTCSSVWLWLKRGK